MIWSMCVGGREIKCQGKRCDNGEVFQRHPSMRICVQKRYTKKAKLNLYAMTKVP